MEPILNARRDGADYQFWSDPQSFVVTMDGTDRSMFLLVDFNGDCRLVPGPLPPCWPPEIREVWWVMADAYNRARSAFAHEPHSVYCRVANTAIRWLTGRGWTMTVTGTGA